MPSGKVGDPGVRGDNGECSKGICEGLRVEFWEIGGVAGDVDGSALRGGKTYFYPSISTIFWTPVF